MAPEQLSYPKVSTFMQESGSLLSPPLEDMLPFIDRDRLEADMLINIHPKSEKVNAK